MRDQLAGAGNMTCLSQLGMHGQTGRSTTEKLIHFDGSTRVFSCDVIPNNNTFLQRFRCLYNFHEAFVALLRLAENLASTSASDLP